MPHINSLQAAFAAAVRFLEGEKLEYVVIGGLASDVWGRPRKTLDADIVVRCSPEEYRSFLTGAAKYGFKFDRQKTLAHLKRMGMCRLRQEGCHVDFIMGYSNFEQPVFARKKRVTLFNVAT